jgi:adenylate cyclase
VALGISLFYLGEVATARTHLQEGLAIYESQGPQGHIFPSGQDLGVLGLTYDAMALWMLGHPERALEQARKGLILAEAAAQPWTLAVALGYAAVIHVLRGDRQAALERAETTIQLAAEQEFPPWVGRGMMLRGWALAEQGQEAEGLTQMQEGLAVWQATGQGLGQPFWLALLAERYGKVGQVEEGLQLLAEALALARTRELCVWEAELQRLRGELLWQQAGGGVFKSRPREASRSSASDVEASDRSRLVTEAETCLRQALETARRQQAKSLELRAAMSLSRLWARRGQKGAARRRLMECYQWFTEGFGTADLREARVLLERLGG